MPAAKARAGNFRQVLSRFSAILQGERAAPQANESSCAEQRTSDLSALFIAIRRPPCLVPSLICLLLLCACAGTPEQPQTEQAQTAADQHAAQRGLVDDRGRFREIYCAVLEEGRSTLPDYRSCDEALTVDGIEQGATGEPVVLGSTVNDYLVLMIHGLGWECFVDWLDFEGSGFRHVAQFGYEVRMVPVDGLSGTDHNAGLIREYIEALPPEDAGRPIILIGYSKGVPDILTALVSYPQIEEPVVAVVGIAGAVAGSPLADDASQGAADMLVYVPGAECDRGDGGAIASLKTAVRQKWLADNPLPKEVEFFSIVTYPSEQRVSRGLKSTYLTLAQVDKRNDTQVLIYDQMIPDSTLLAYVNADHWAVAVPVARNHPFVANALVDQNSYPREALLEAILRYLDARLSQPPGTEKSAVESQGI